MGRVNRVLRGGGSTAGLACLCLAASAALFPTAAAAAEPAARSEDTTQADYEAMAKPTLDFLHLVNQKFPGRECVRDRSHLNADYDKIALSIVRMFLIRDDLRKDMRELAMRLATFQPMPADVRHLAIPMAIPPASESEKKVNALIVQTRTAFWKKLDEIEARYPAAAPAKGAGEKMGLIITVNDRGWRPDAPTAFHPERDECGPA